MDQISVLFESLPVRAFSQFFLLRRDFAGNPVGSIGQQTQQVMGTLLHPIHQVPFGIKTVQQRRIALHFPGS